MALPRTPTPDIHYLPYHSHIVVAKCVNDLESRVTPGLRLFISRSSSSISLRLSANSVSNIFHALSMVFKFLPGQTTTIPSAMHFRTVAVVHLYLDRISSSND